MMRGMGLPFTGINEAVLLVALGIGYIVCYLANREEKTLKTTGYLIGIFIILLSGILILNNLVLGARFCRKMGGMMPRVAMPGPAQPQK